MLRIWADAMTPPLTEAIASRDSAARICYRTAMPFLDPFGPLRRTLPRFPFRDALQLAEWAEAQERRRRRRRRKDLDDGGVPVEPNKPRNLSGGAAAPLEFEDDSDT